MIDLNLKEKVAQIKLKTKLMKMSRIELEMIYNCVRDVWTKRTQKK